MADDTPRELRFFKYGCCFPTHDMFWMLVAMLFGSILIVSFCTAATMFVRWTYKRRLRKKVGQVKEKYRNEEQYRLAQNFKLKEIAKRPLATNQKSDDAQMANDDEIIEQILDIQEQNQRRWYRKKKTTQKGKSSAQRATRTYISRGRKVCSSVSCFNLTPVNRHFFDGMKGKTTSPRAISPLKTAPNNSTFTAKKLEVDKKRRNVEKVKADREMLTATVDHLAKHGVQKKTAIDGVMIVDSKPFQHGIEFSTPTTSPSKLALSIGPKANILVTSTSTPGTQGTTGSIDGSAGALSSSSTGTTGSTASGSGTVVPSCSVETSRSSQQVTEGTTESTGTVTASSSIDVNAQSGGSVDIQGTGPSSDRNEAGRSRSLNGTHLAGAITSQPTTSLVSFPYYSIDTYNQSSSPNESSSAMVPPNTETWRRSAWLRPQYRTGRTANSFSSRNFSRESFAFERYGSMC